MVAPDRGPSVGHTVEAGAVFNGAWSVRSVIEADEFITACIESADVLIDMEHCVVISAFAVFCLVINAASCNLYLSDGEVSLEIGGVILGVPKTEFNIAVKIYFFGCRGAVCDGEPCEFAVFMKRYEHLLNGIQAVL